MPPNHWQKAGIIIIIVCVAVVSVSLHLGSSSSSSSRQRRQFISKYRTRQQQQQQQQEGAKDWLQRQVTGTRACDEDCHAFRRQLEAWPRDQPRAVIYYLISRRALPLLRQSISALQRNFNSKFHYPIVVFIGGQTANASDRRAIHDMVLDRQTSVYVQTANFRASPQYRTLVAKLAAKQPVPDVDELARKFGGWFHVSGVFTQPLMQSPLLQYVMKMNHRQALAAPVNDDLFSAMHHGQLLYGFDRLVHDKSFVDEGLWNAIDHYASDNHIKTPFFSGWTAKGVARYSADFELSSVSVWKSQPFRDYMTFIERHGGFDRRGWNSATIRTIAVTLFVPRPQTHRFAELVFEHTRVGPRRNSSLRRT